MIPSLGILQYKNAKNRSLYPMDRVSRRLVWKKHQITQESMLWKSSLLRNARKTSLGPLEQPKLPGGLFIPSDKWKKLSQANILHFPTFGMGTCVHQAKYQGALQMFTGVYRVILNFFCNICRENPEIFTDCRESAGKIWK